MQSQRRRFGQPPQVTVLPSSINSRFRRTGSPLSRPRDVFIVNAVRDVDSPLLRCSPYARAQRPVVFEFPSQRPSPRVARGSTLFARALAAIELDTSSFQKVISTAADRHLPLGLFARTQDGHFHMAPLLIPGTRHVCTYHVQVKYLLDV